MDIVHQLRRGVRLWRTAGGRATAQRVARAAYHRLDATSLEFPLLPEDVADSRRLSLPGPPHIANRSRPLRVGFVCTPPQLRSGGHTTMFRMVTALEVAGHECTLFLYDRYGGDLAEHEAIIRRGWPAVRADVLDARCGITGVDASVATAWQTAHVLARRAAAPMRMLYLVQDFEPFFYPRGAEYSLAEDSYRFGFRCIAVGHMVADVLRDAVGVDADVVEFGCDTDVYRLAEGAAREGVVFYSKPRAARRGFILAVLALQELNRRRPEVPIHVVGDSDVRLPFPATVHGSVSPPELAELYNRTRAGVALSFTNITLLADELLACGTVPVVNDSAYARADVSSEYVRWAAPTPSGIADELVAILDLAPDPRLVAGSAHSDAWRPGQAAFVRAVEEASYGA
jgi:glycosyltransferase involved in cell wall biosynthesis